MQDSVYTEPKSKNAATALRTLRRCSEFVIAVVLPVLAGCGSSREDRLIELAREQARVCNEQASLISFLCIFIVLVFVVGLLLYAGAESRNAAMAEQLRRSQAQGPSTRALPHHQNTIDVEPMGKETMKCRS